MNILYVQPGLGIGGSKLSLLQMVKHAPAGQCSFLALSKPPDPAYEKLLGGSARNIFYLELPTWQKYRRKSLFEKLKAPLSHLYRLAQLIPAVHSLVKIIREQKIDLVHTNNSICPAGALAARLTRAPHVWHVRESIGSTRQYPLILGDYISAWLFHKLSDGIVCNSEFTTFLFKKFGYPTQVILNGIDITQFEKPDSQTRYLREKLFSDPISPVIAMVGNLTTTLKKHDQFLDAAAIILTKAPQSNFIVFGGSSNLDQTPYTKQLKAKAVQLGIAEKIIWADFLDDIPAMLNTIDILIHPASTEGSGRVVMEAMAAGKCVIGVKSGGVQELIQDGITGFLVEPDHPDQLADRAIYAIRNPAELQSIGVRAREFAQANFSIERMLCQVNEIYSQVTRR